MNSADLCSALSEVLKKVGEESFVNVLTLDGRKLTVSAVKAGQGCLVLNVKADGGDLVSLVPVAAIVRVDVCKPATCKKASPECISKLQ